MARGVESMADKKLYEKPVVEIIRFDAVDVVTMSGLLVSQFGYGDSIDYFNLPNQ